MSDNRSLFCFTILIIFLSSIISACENKNESYRLPSELAAKKAEQERAQALARQRILEQTVREQQAREQARQAALANAPRQQYTVERTTIIRNEPTPGNTVIASSQNARVTPVTTSRQEETYTPPVTQRISPQEESITTTNNPSSSSQQVTQQIASTQTSTTKHVGPDSFKSYAYLLQNSDINTLLSNHRDIYVIDIDESHFTQSQIAQLKSKGSTVLSYLSIGEAEDYRTYWQQGWGVGNPSFLDEENPDWRGNFKVKYWDPKWQELILRNLDKIVDAGYDGVYLDIIDAYEYYQEKGVVDADQKMIDWVAIISRRAKSKNPNFLIVPQNALPLVDKPGYLEVIDGLGKESTWYEAEDMINPDWSAEAIAWLDKAKSDGKFILVIDYPTNTAKRCDFITKARAHGFVPTVGPLDLGRIESMPSC